VLGLPSLVAVQADNQAPIAAALAEAGVQINLGRSSGLVVGDYAAALSEISPELLHTMSNAASTICDGAGVERMLGTISGIRQS
jgi:spore coat polysaccharide biosynthesis predicted glycosyltransferase SpsG